MSTGGARPTTTIETKAIPTKTQEEYTTFGAAPNSAEQPLSKPASESEVSTKSTSGPLDWIRKRLGR